MALNITWKPSPNFDSNRVKIDKILIHWIVGNIAAADAVFAQPGNASAHYAVEDNTVHQYVLEDKVAYHAGNYPMNQRSFGIEHSAAPNRPATEATYQTSGRLIYELCDKYGIPIDRQHIIKHSEVTSTQCPGTMNIDKLIAIAQSHNKPVPTPTPPPVNVDFKKVVTESKRYVYGYQTEGTVTQRMAKVIEIYKKHGVQK